MGRNANVVNRRLVRLREKSRGFNTRFPVVGSLFIRAHSFAKGESAERRTYRLLGLAIDADLRSGNFLKRPLRCAPATSGWDQIRHVTLVQWSDQSDPPSLVELGALAGDAAHQVVCVARDANLELLDCMSDMGLVGIALDSWQTLEDVEARLRQMFPHLETINGRDVGGDSAVCTEASVSRDGHERASRQLVDSTSLRPDLQEHLAVDPREERDSLLQVDPPSAVTRVNIVDYESGYGGNWVLSTIAQQLAAGLRALGLVVDVSPVELPGYDVNHHIPFYACTATKGEALHSCLVTHIDVPGKIEYMRYALDRGVVAICMSSETSLLLQQSIPGRGSDIHWVTPPAIRGSTSPRIRLGCFFRLYGDNRKSEGELTAAARLVGGDSLSLFLMGSGWSSIAPELEALGCIVQVSDEFDPLLYEQWMQEIDFAIYLGTDEGAMFFMDALAAGRRVVVPYAGYHADLPHPLVTYALGAEEIADALRPEIRLRRSAHALVGISSWSEYASAHLRIWSAAKLTIALRSVTRDCGSLRRVDETAPTSLES